MEIQKPVVFTNKPNDVIIGPISQAAINFIEKQESWLLNECDQGFRSYDLYIPDMPDDHKVINRSVTEIVHLDACGLAVELDENDKPEAIQLDVNAKVKVSLSFLGDEPYEETFFVTWLNFRVKLDVDCNRRPQSIKEFTFVKTRPQLYLEEYSHFATNLL